MISGGALQARAKARTANPVPSTRVRERDGSARRRRLTLFHLRFSMSLIIYKWVNGMAVEIEKAETEKRETTIHRQRHNHNKRPVVILTSFSAVRALGALLELLEDGEFDLWLLIDAMVPSFIRFKVQPMLPITDHSFYFSGVNKDEGAIITNVCFLSWLCCCMVFFANLPNRSEVCEP